MDQLTPEAAYRALAQSSSIAEVLSDYYNAQFEEAALAAANASFPAEERLAWCIRQGVFLQLRNALKKG